MKNRNDMYINYERSNRKRNNKGNHHLWIIICCVLVLAGLGYGVYRYAIPELFTAKSNSSRAEANAGNTTKLTQVPQVTKAAPTITPNPTPTVLPTLTPTIAPTVTPAVEVSSPGNAITGVIKGLYVPARSAASSKLDNLIEIAEDTEINAMVIDIKDDHGRISYAMDCDLAKEIGADTKIISDMPALIQILKEKNIYLIARIVAFKDPFLAKMKPELAIKNQDGSTYVDSNGEAWVNPYNKKVWDYLVDVASHAANVGFDEVQFDYIRFSTSKAIAQADFGDEAAGISKEQIITDFTKYAYEKLKPLGVYVSADVYGTIIASAVDAGLVGQNYVDMAKNLDYICPMIYPSHFGQGNLGIKYPDMEPYQIINKVLSISAEKLEALPEDEHHAIVRPWLQDFTATWVDHHIKYGGEEIRDQIEGVYSVGYKEWLLWNAASNYTEDGLLKE